MHIKPKKESQNEGSVCSEMKGSVWVKYPHFCEIVGITNFTDMKPQM